MDDYFYQTVAKKTDRYELLKDSLYLKEYLLDTRTLSVENLISMCTHYPFITYKPDMGERLDVGTITKEQTGYKLTSRRERLSFLNPVRLCGYVKKLMGGKDTLLQQGIAPAHCDGRPFTMNVAAQRVLDRWDVVGAVAKVRSGTAVPLEHALKDCGISAMELRFIRAQLSGMTHQAGVTLTKKYEHLRELLVTAIMDDGHRLYLSEVDTAPSYKLFSMMGDDTLYRQILASREHINSRTIKRITKY